MQFRRMAGVALPVAQGEAVGSDQYFMDKRQSANLFANLERGRIEGGENGCLLRDGESPDMTALHPEIFRPRREFCRSPKPERIARLRRARVRKSGHYVTLPADEVHAGFRAGSAKQQSALASGTCRRLRHSGST